MPPFKKPKFKWSPEDMEAAVDAVKHGGMNPYAASKKFNVPRTTLLLKTTSKAPLKTRLVN